MLFFKHRVKLMQNFIKPILSAAVLFLLILTSCTRDEYDLKMVTVKDNNTIWIMNVDGSDRKALTNTVDDGICKDPSWSADGEKIVYISDLSGTNRLCIMDYDGGGKRILYTSAGGVLYDPSFYPDGNKIILGCVDGNLYEYSFSDAIVTSINTFVPPLQYLSISSEGSICFIDINTAYVYTPGGAWAPVGGNANYGATYSPDGKNIAYAFSANLYIVNSDTAGLDGAGSLITTPISNAQIAWDPAGDYIYYETATGISRIRPAAGSIPEVVVNDSAFKYPQIQGKSK